MAQDIFLRLTGIAGESMDASHSNEIEVLTWDWSVSQQSNMHMGLVKELCETLRVSFSEIYRHPEVSYKRETEASTANWD
ncbi:hypothetical protein WI72_31835 [Burkholderia ubonensis]|uniref:type VI secretion system tube protein Hcp n=1 Tax=Burkholderia ubonensis TaxID=101571 RepID=UPI000754EE9D|nr:type VI secretion system tube protein Hcp [Burkholderia ubonensis]KVC46883.1 hypothetical protein WI72_31835 [Burkholderia ubonensis]KVD95981.1 hypothetical protein WI90_04260 [Burkholderia ubonensis]